MKKIIILQKKDGLILFFIPNKKGFVKTFNNKN